MMYDGSHLPYVYVTVLIGLELELTFMCVEMDNM